MTELRSKLTDLTMLLKLGGGDTGFTLEMITIFETNTPVYFSEFTAALAAADRPAIGAIAHKMVPTGFYMGALALKPLLQKIENAADNGAPLETLTLYVRDAEHLCAGILAELAAVKSTLEGTRS